MTKTITLPITHETCHKIKVGVGLGVWILGTFGLIYAFHSAWFDTYNMDLFDRVIMGIFTTLGTFFSIIFMLLYFHDKGFWINFECKCEAKKPEI